MSPAKKRKADELTTEEAAKMLFGKRIVKAVRKEVSETGDSVTEEDKD